MTSTFSSNRQGGGARPLHRVASNRTLGVWQAGALGAMIVVVTDDDCQSCGRDDEPLTEVRRIYITPASWESEEKRAPAAATERWCDICMAHYPHEVIG